MTTTLSRSGWSGRLTCTVGGVAVDVWVHPDSIGDPQCYTYQRGMNVDPTGGVQINGVDYFGSFQPGFRMLHRGMIGLDDMTPAAARKFEAAEQAIYDAARELPGYGDAARQQIRYYAALDVEHRAQDVAEAEAALAEARRRYDNAAAFAAAAGAVTA